MHFRKIHFSKILRIFGGLVLGCIKTKFCKKICVRQHFSSSTRFASFCTAAISRFSQKIGLKKQHFSWNFSKKNANVVKFAKFCQIPKNSVWESGRFWKMLQNAYFLAKIGADTAENEQHFAEILPTDALWRLRRATSASKASASRWPGPAGLEIRTTRNRSQKHSSLLRQQHHHSGTILQTCEILPTSEIC